MGREAGSGTGSVAPFAAHMGSMTKTADRTVPGPFPEIIADYPRTWTEEGNGRRHVNFSHCITRPGHDVEPIDASLPHDRLASLVYPSMYIGAAGIILMVITGLVSLAFTGAGHMPEAWIAAARATASVGLACFLFAAAVITSPRALLRPAVRRWESRNIDWWNRNGHLFTEVMDIGGSRRDEVCALVFSLQHLSRTLNELKPDALTTARANTAIAAAMAAIWDYIDIPCGPGNEPASDEAGEMAAFAAASKVADVEHIVRGLRQTKSDPVENE